MEPDVLLMLLLDGGIAIDCSNLPKNFLDVGVIPILRRSFQFFLAIIVLFSRVTLMFNSDCQRACYQYGFCNNESCSGLPIMDVMWSYLYYDDIVWIIFLMR